MDRHAKLLWMKDLLEHLADCHEKWELAGAAAQRYLAESMKRDLDEFRRLCDSLGAESPAELETAAIA